MDHELEYVRGRAIEEREAARAATCLKAREAHVKLAEAFERRVDELECNPA
jgi:hypothetical protein